MPQQQVPEQMGQKQLNKDKSIKITFQVENWAIPLRIADREKLSKEDLYFFYRDNIKELEKHLVS